MNARGRWRRLALGLPTVLGIAKRGFFIPYRYADALPDAAVLPRYEAAEALFAAQQAGFAAVLADLDKYRGAFDAIAADRGQGAARFDQDWFPTLDAAIAYRMVRELAPARIVEIGSGHSTRFMARAIADGALATMLTAIDPAPRAEIRALPIRHIEGTIPPRATATVASNAAGAGNAAMDAIRSLAAGDILFVDSSHILVPGSDVDFLLNRVLPSLPAGAIVHVHDILLPDPYPARWDWYGYNEQNAVLPLLAGGAFRPLFASHYVATRMADALARSVVASLPQVDGAIPASLWLEKMRVAAD
jgi:hypothetical protein